MSGKPIDLKGQVFTYLTVLDRDTDSGNGKKPIVKWLCQCKCGKIISVPGGQLRSSHTVSCGCRKVKHGFANKERLYQTWSNMRRRCNNPNNNRWEQYGGRGITICAEWDDYAAFRSWALSHGYNDALSIDRIDVDGNYCPANCRWVDSKTQANNVTRNRIIKYRGIKATMSEFAEQIGLSYSALQHRLDRGWSIDRIVSTQQRRW